MIDVETLFQHQSSIINLTENAFNNAYRECIDSIVGTALVPIIAFGQGKNKKGVDISALNGDEQVLPGKVLVIVDSNKDTMRFEYGEIKIHGANNIPTLNGEKVSFFKYIKYIIEGFENGMDFVMQHKEEFIGENGILNIFKDIPVRHLLKATQNYARLMSFASHPNYTGNMIKLERMFTNAWAYNYRDKRAVRYEVEDMLGGDIPIFYGMVNSRDLISSRGEVIKDYFSKSAYDKVVEKVENLSKEIINKQTGQIKVSLGIYEQISEERFIKRQQNKIEPKSIDVFGKDKEQLLKKAEEIADRIINEMIQEPNSGTITWNNTLYDYINECWKIRPLDNSLTYGVSGVFMFLYRLNKYVKKDKYTEILSKLLNILLEDFGEDVELGAYEGLAAMIYPLLSMYKDTKQQFIYNQVYKITRIIERKLDNIADLDLKSGYVGIVKCMVNAYKVLQEDICLGVARKSVNKILEKLDLDYCKDLAIRDDLLGIHEALKAFNEVEESTDNTSICMKLEVLKDDRIGERINKIKVTNKLEDSLAEGR